MGQSATGLAAAAGTTPHERFARMRKAVREQGFPAYEQRRERLDRLLGLTLAYRTRFLEAVSADFGHRSKHETALAEIYPAVANMRHARRKLSSWMKPKRAPLSLVFLPARASIVYEPLGVVGILSPWNYPLLLALIPVAEAMAAGNRVMLKPSELTPATSEVLRELFANGFDEDEATVITGGVEVAQDFARLPFDHLFFTGSTNVGRHVMRAAAENLTPVTLELGGKSPALVHEDYDLARAAERITFGKLLNAGQTCIAPDYALVHERKVDAFVSAIQSAAARLYGRYEGNSNYSSIVSDRHRERLVRLLDEAEKGGAKLVRLGDPAVEEEEKNEGSRKLAPTLVIGAKAEMTLLKEEIFGPILPIVPYSDLEQALRYINERDKPLAFYYFDDDGRRIEAVRARTSSGGMVVNDTLLHIAQEELGFGGVGPSGMGRYHGFEGFKTFSNQRAVYYQSRWAQTWRFQPPYLGFIDKMLRWLIGY
ncbi:MAG: coniferyl aldehyde dehydrogenase [Myxococcota bacterium]